MPINKCDAKFFTSFVNFFPPDFFSKPHQYDVTEEASKSVVCADDAGQCFILRRTQLAQNWTGLVFTNTTG